jgi:hypothetical protein
MREDEADVPETDGGLHDEGVSPAVNHAPTIGGVQVRENTPDRSIQETSDTSAPEKQA